MDRSHSRRGALTDIAIHAKLKLSALWASVMFTYVYGDIFNLFEADMLRELLAGETPVGPTTPLLLTGFSVMMAIPSLMVTLTLVLKAPASRWLNIAVGIIYSVIVALTMQGASLNYLFMGSLDVILTLLIAWIAWTWPRGSAS